MLKLLEAVGLRLLETLARRDENELIAELRHGRGDSDIGQSLNQFNLI